VSVSQSPWGILKHLQMRKGLKYINFPEDFIKIRNQEKEKNPRESLHFSDIRETIKEIDVKAQI